MRHSVIECDNCHKEWKFYNRPKTAIYIEDLTFYSQNKRWPDNIIMVEHRLNKKDFCNLNFFTQYIKEYLENTPV